MYNAQHIQVVGDVYMIHNNNTQLQWFQFEGDSHYNQLTNSFQVGNWGQDGYPKKGDVRRVAVYGSAANTYACVGFIFSHISGQDRNAEWKFQHNFGLYPTYINKYGPASQFKKVSKSWRLGGKPINDGINAWNHAAITVEWDKIFLILRHARISARVKSVFWKLFSNRLYVGELAYDYLYKHHKFEANRDVFRFCPCCGGYTPATYQHIFYDCPKVKSFWDYIKCNAFPAVNQVCPINSFHDLNSFFGSFDRVNNIIKIVHDELIYYAIYSVYCSYRILIQKCHCAIRP